MNNPEEPGDIHGTLLEIDELFLNNLVDREVINYYRQIRGPWRQRYTGNVEERGKFATESIRDFRNQLANLYNSLLRETNQNFDRFELDERDYKIVTEVSDEVLPEMNRDITPTFTKR